VAAKPRSPVIGQVRDPELVRDPAQVQYSVEISPAEPVEACAPEQQHKDRAVALVRGLAQAHAHLGQERLADMDVATNRIHTASVEVKADPCRAEIGAGFPPHVRAVHLEEVVAGGANGRLNQNCHPARLKY